MSRIFTLHIQEANQEPTELHFLVEMTNTRKTITDAIHAVVREFLRDTLEGMRYDKEHFTYRCLLDNTIPHWLWAKYGLKPLDFATIEMTVNANHDIIDKLSTTKDTINAVECHFDEIYTNTKKPYPYLKDPNMHDIERIASKITHANNKDEIHNACVSVLGLKK